MKIQTEKNYTNIVVIIATFLVYFILRIIFPNIFNNFYSAIPYGLASHDRVFLFSGGDHVQIFYLAWKLGGLYWGRFLFFSDPYNFAAQGQIFYDLQIGFQFWWLAFWMKLLGNFAGYNFGFIVLPICLSVLSCFFMLSPLVRSRSLCILASMCFALTPYRIHQVIGGHSGGMIYAFVPLYLGAIIRHRWYPKGSFNAILAGLTLFVITISEEHIGYYLLIVSAFVFPYWIIYDWSKKKTLRSLWSNIVHWKYLILGLLVTLSFGFIVNALLYSTSAGSVVKSFDEIRHYSVNINGFIRGNSQHNIGNVIFRALPFFALLFFVLVPKRFNVKNDIFVFIAIFPILLCLMFGVRSHWSQSSGIYEFFYHYFPFFSYQRVPLKMSSIVICFLLLLTCFLFRQIETSLIEDKLSALKWRLLNGMKFLLVVCFLMQFFVFVYYFHKYKPGIFMDSLAQDDSKLHKLILQHSDSNSIILLLPTARSMGRYATYRQVLAIHTKRKFYGGYNGVAPTHYWDTLQSIGTLEIESSASAYKDLKKLGITHILSSNDLAKKEGVNNLNKNLSAYDYLNKLSCDGSRCLFKVQHDQKNETERSTRFYHI